MSLALRRRTFRRNCASSKRAMPTQIRARSAPITQPPDPIMLPVTTSDASCATFSSMPFARHRSSVRLASCDSVAACVIIGSSRRSSKAIIFFAVSRWFWSSATSTRSSATSSISMAGSLRNMRSNTNTTRPWRSAVTWAGVGSWCNTSFTWGCVRPKPDNKRGSTSNMAAPKTPAHCRVSGN